MTKLIKVIETIKPEFEKVKKYLHCTEEKIENFSHEELAEKFSRMTDEFFAMLEQIYEAYEDAPKCTTCTNFLSLDQGSCFGCNGKEYKKYKEKK